MTDAACELGNAEEAILSLITRHPTHLLHTTLIAPALLLIVGRLLPSPHGFAGGLALYALGSQFTRAELLT